MSGRRDRAPRDLAQDLVRIALDAGELILDVYDSDFTVERKEDASPVTEADQRAEDCIIRKLKEIAPEIPILAEEAVSEGHVPEIGRRFFLVDPLDGTKEFIRRNGEFTVNIALIEDGAPVAGVVHAPALGLTCIAAPDLGAREATVSPRNRPGQDDWQPLSVRACPADGPTAVASRSHRDEATNAFLEAHGVSETKSAGSSLKFCLIARGIADVYPRFGRTMEWDTAAGQAVLTAAGGSVVTEDGMPLRYGKRERGYDNPAFIAWGRRPG